MATADAGRPRSLGVRRIARPSPRLVVPADHRLRAGFDRGSARRRNTPPVRFARCRVESCGRIVGNVPSTDVGASSSRGASAQVQVVWNIVFGAEPVPNPNRVAAGGASSAIEPRQDDPPAKDVARDNPLARSRGLTSRLVTRAFGSASARSGGTSSGTR
jgi:hypothetical protein